MTRWNMKYRTIFALLLASLFAAKSFAMAATTLEVRVSSDTDDAEERSNGSMYLDSSDLELINDDNDQTVGIRFQNISVPKNATITKAYIQFKVDETGNANGELEIAGQAHNNPPNFSSTEGDITNRTPTSGSVSWMLDGDNRWTSEDALKNTPELKSIVQEIVNRAGWISGQSMVFMISGSGKRVADSHDGSSSGAPLLHIEYEEAAAAPIIRVNPAAALGATSYFGTNATPSSFELTNAGTASLLYTITDDAAWLHCTANCSGTLPAGSSAVVGVTFSNFTMATGSYTGHFTITDTANRVAPYEYDVQLQINEVAAGSTCGEVPIYAQDLVDPAILVLLDVSSSMTALMPVTSSTDNPTTPDLKAIVQEIISRNDWASGNSMAFIVTGSGKRVANSYDGVSSAAPLLKINYTSGGIPGSIESRVNQTNDDAEQSSGGAIDLTSSDLELVQESTAQTVGLRFQGIAIPPGATVTSASIEFTVDEADPTITTNLTIKGQSIGNAPVFANTTNDISSRTTTAASVPWTITTPWTSPPQKARYIIGREVISELVEDQTISWGYGTWAFSGYTGPGNTPNTSLLPANPYGASQTDLYTQIRAGIKHRAGSETTALKAIIEATTTTSGTPFGPSLLAAKEYYDGNKADTSGDTYNSNLTCQPRFLINITDGLGYSPHTSVDIINKYAHLLADKKISTVAVGFGIDDATQIAELAKVANNRGKAATDLYALHPENANGDGMPFLAQNQEELTDALQSITNSIKQQIFIGSSPAPSTSVDSGTFVIHASFNAATWTGDLTATPYDPKTGALMMCVDQFGNKTCDPADIAGKCLDVGSISCDTDDIVEGDCLCWTASEKMVATKNAWTVDGDVSASGASLTAGIAGRYVADHTSLSGYEIGLAGDNYICRNIGDIIKSTPVIVEPPSKFYSFDRYRFFKFGAARNRPDMLYVGANDGALHAFSLKTGVETWRFLPEALHQKLIDTDICASGYCHEYFVDGTPVAADIYRGTSFDLFSGTPPALTASGWRTILVNGLGAGGDAYFALDITSANSFVENGTNPLTATTYLWQFTDDELGLTMGVPAIARVNSAEANYGGWMAFFGSGYNTAPSLFKESYVYGIDAYSAASRWFNAAASTDFNRIQLEQNDRISYVSQTGTEFSAGQTVTGNTSGAAGVIATVSDAGDSGTLILTGISGAFADGEGLKVGADEIATLSGPLHSAYYNDALSDTLLADPDFDNIADYLYIGSMYGRMYRLHNLGKNQEPVKGVLFDIHPSSINHNTPIRAGASVGYDSHPGTIWIYFGSGKFEEQGDKFNEEQQYFIALKDYKGAAVATSTLTDLLKRTTVAEDATFNGVTQEYRIMTGHSFVYEGSSTLTVGHKMVGSQSGATGIIQSLTTLGTKTIVTFVESDFPANGTFSMGEEIVDDSDSTIRVRLKNHPWYATLQHPAGSPSERVLARSLVAGGVVFFTTFVPDEDACGGNGSAWLYALDYETGLPPAHAVFDINGDNLYDENDVVTHDEKKYPVGAIPIGRGIPSAPVLEGDTIFVNTTDTARPGLPVNLPSLKAKISAWKDGGF